MTEVRAVPKGGVRRLWATLLTLNATAWVWAFIMFYASPAALATALMVYGLGLRHAVDGDHIAAIDNVTRKLLQLGRRPVGVGLFFALGHSAVVVLIVLFAASAAGALQRIEAVKSFGGLVSTGVSAAFLLAVALINLGIFLSLHRIHRRRESGQVPSESDLSNFQSTGVLSRLLRPLFAVVSRSWHMLLVGFLFGLGFDTATEVTLLSMSISQSAHGVSLVTVMVFPLLFAAGMALLDSVNGLMMLGAYEWALTKPLAKMRYNMVITLASVIVATTIACIQGAGIVIDQLGSHGPFAKAIESLRQSINLVGFAAMTLILIAWLLAARRLRLRHEQTGTRTATLAS